MGKLLGVNKDCLFAHKVLKTLIYLFLDGSSDQFTAAQKQD